MIKFLKGMYETVKELKKKVLNKNGTAFYTVIHLYRYIRNILGKQSKPGMWWYMPKIPTVGRQSDEDYEFKVNPGYMRQGLTI